MLLMCRNEVCQHNDEENRMICVGGRLRITIVIKNTKGLEVCKKTSEGKHVRVKSWAVDEVRKTHSSVSQK